MKYRFRIDESSLSSPTLYRNLEGETYTWKMVQDVDYGPIWLELTKVTANTSS